MGGGGQKVCPFYLFLLITNSTSDILVDMILIYYFIDLRNLDVRNK